MFLQLSPVDVFIFIFFIYFLKPLLMTACVLFFSHQLSSLEAPSSSVSGPPVPSRSCSASRCPSPLFQSHAAESTTLTKHAHPNTVTCADNHHKPARVMGSLSPRSGECSGTLVPTSDWRVEVPLTQSLCDTLCAWQGRGSDGGQRRSRPHTNSRRWELTEETVGPGRARCSCFRSDWKHSGASKKAACQH